jgi:hypothetical protein
MGHWASLWLRSGQVGIGHWAQEAPGTPGAEEKNLYNNSPHTSAPLSTSLPISPAPPLLHLPLSLRYET